MKRTLIALLLILSLLTSVVCAYTPQDENIADALNDLGLFQGMGGTKGYALDDSLTRGQGITLLVRMIGKEAEAEKTTYNNAFTDASWAAPYIGYAYANGITNGMSETKFGTDVPMTDNMFLTLTLRALKYSDSGETPMFTWDKPYELAHQLGMISAAKADTAFTRADAIRVFWNAMDVELYGSDDTLADTLIAQGVFTAAQWEAAQQTQQFGRQDAEDTEDEANKNDEEPQHKDDLTDPFEDQKTDEDKKPADKPIEGSPVGGIGGPNELPRA